MILIELTRKGGTQALVGELLDLEDHGAARRVRSHLVSDADGVARANGIAVQPDEPALARVVCLRARLEDARGAQPAIDAGTCAHDTRHRG